MLERFVVQPSIKLFGGIEIKEDTKFDDQNEDGSVVQRFEDGKLHTMVCKEEKYTINGVECTTTYTQSIVQDVPVGTILIWGEDTGYIIPNYKMVRVSEAIESLEILKEVENNDIRGNEGEGTDSN